jgi:hypothetical protein
VTALREEKLRALGVILDDGPPTQPGSIGGGDTPLVIFLIATALSIANMLAV